MITIDQVRTLALSYPDTVEEPHFERIAFKVSKKIFATYDGETESINARLSEVDQDVFSKANESGIYPVPNKWGLQGWTTIELSKVDMELFSEVLMAAYIYRAPDKLARQLKSDMGSK